MLIQNIVFIVFSVMLVFSAIMVVCARNPVISALYLVYAFFNSAVLWMLLQAEFLSLVLIFVYVGAVMTLFMFVVMMLNIDTEVLRKGFVKYLPIGLLVVALVVGMMIYIIAPEHFSSLTAVKQPADYSNTKALGDMLYTHYVYPFEIAAVLLLAAIIAAISLTHKGKPKRKVQDIDKQLSAGKSRLRIIKMPSEKKSEGKSS